MKRKMPKQPIIVAGLKTIQDKWFFLFIMMLSYYNRTDIISLSLLDIGVFDIKSFIMMSSKYLLLIDEIKLSIRSARLKKRRKNFLAFGETKRSIQGIPELVLL